MGERLPSPHSPSTARRRHAGRGRRWQLLVVGALFLGLSTLPYLYGAAVTAPGRVFTWTPTLNGADACVYLAQILRVQRGAWLLGSPFTGEPHAPRLFLPHVILLGRVGGALGLEPVAVLQVGRLLAAAAMLLAGYGLAATCLRAGRVRCLALWLIAFSGGLSGYFALGAAFGLGPPPPTADAAAPEANTFHSAQNLFQLSLATALMAGIVTAIVRHWRRGGIGALAAVAVLAALLLFVHPWDLVAMVGTGVGLFFVALVRRDRPDRLLAAGAALAAGVLPGIVYYRWVLADPFYVALARDARPLPPPSFYLLAFILQLVLALGLLRRGAWRRELAAPLCWVATVAICLSGLVPLGDRQYRLVGGVHLPLCVLAAAGLDSIGRGCVAGRPARRRYRWITRVCVALTLPGTLLILLRQMQFYGDGTWLGHYHPVPLRQAMGWLDRHAPPGALVLGGPVSGEWVPALTHCRSYAGHWQFTLDRPRKAWEQAQFYQGLPANRYGWLMARGIRYVVWWPGEWNVRIAPLDGEPGLALSWASAEVRLYEVRAMRE